MNASDPDGDEIELSASNLPSFASFTDNGNGTGDLDFEPKLGDSGTYELTVTASDGNLTDSENVSIVVANFVDETVFDGLNSPVEITFLPDGRLLILQKNGKILIVNPSNSTADTYMDLSVETSGERGLLGIALDPDFTSNGYFYLYYTGPDNYNRISRFTHEENSGGLSSRGNVSSEVELWVNPDDADNCCHFGGGFGIGPDGKIHLTTGEEFEGEQAQNLSKADGKLIRINRDGSIPSDNPFVDDSDALDEIWAYGLRNPFTATWDDETGRFFIGEVGGNDDSVAQEDIHVGEKAANYGWPDCEGNCENPEYTDPIYTYPHNGSGASISVGTVYRGQQFPEEYRGALFFGDYVDGWIQYLKFDGNGNVTGNFTFAEGVGAVVDIHQGPNGSLYYVDIGAETVGRFYVADGPPTITNVSATPTSGDPPLNVTFNSTATDPDGDNLTYTWHFGDGTKENGQNLTHTYDDAGVFTVRLAVSDGNYTVKSDPIDIEVGDPPNATITAPENNSLFRAGDIIEFTGNASDPQDGNLTGDSLSWEVRFIHDEHTHPVLDDVNGSSGEFEIPTSGHDYSGDTGYKIILTAEDSDGLTDTEVVYIWPDKVNLTLQTNQSGLELYLDGITKDTPYTHDTLINFTHSVGAPSAQCIDGKVYEFVNWSDGGAQTHNYTVPENDSSITANYERSGRCEATPEVAPVLQLEVDQGVTTSGSNVTSWQDQSGQNNDVSANGEPTIVENATPGGTAAISFDGDDDELVRTGSLNSFPTGNQNRTIFVVVRYNSTGFGGVAFGSPNCNQAFGAVVNDNGDLTVQGWCDDFPSGVEGVGAGWMVQSIVLRNNTFYHYKNGDLIDSGSHTFDTVLDKLAIGSELNAPPFVDMDGAAVYVYDQALNESTRIKAEDYFQEKYLNTTTNTTNDSTTLTTSVPVTEGLALGLNASKGVTTSSGNVTGWTDLSGQGNDLTANGAPTLEAAATPNGTAAISFDGDDDELVRTATLNGFSTGSQNRTVIVVARYNSTGFGGVAYGSPNCNQAFGAVVDDQGDLTLQGWCDDFSSGADGTGAGWLIQSIVLSNDTFVHYMNGTQIDTGSHTFDTTAEKLAIGSELAAPPYLNMDVAAIYIYNRSLNDTEHQQVLTHLRETHFVTGNQAPTAKDDSGSVTRNNSTTIDVLANDADPDGTLNHSSVVIEQPPTNGTVTVNSDGSVTYDHDGSDSTSDSFAYSVEDDDGARSNRATVNVSISDSTTSTTGPSLPITDGLVLALNASNGVNSSDGNVTGWADLSSKGNDLRANGAPTHAVDGTPGGTAAISFDGDDDELVRTDTLNGFPTGNKNRTVFIVVRYNSTGFGGVAYGSPNCNQAFGAIVDDQGYLTVQGWCSENDFSSSTVGTGAGWLIQSIVVSNDTFDHYQNGTQIDSGSHVFDTTAEKLAIGSELDAPPYLDMDAAAVYLYNRSLNATEHQEVISYLTETHFESINEAPTANDDSASVEQGNSTTIEVLANDSDPDGTLNNSSVLIEQSPQNGSVTVNADGSITYTHDGSDTSSDSFAYSVADDDDARSNVATVNVSITNTNEAPTANDDSASVKEGNATTIEVLANDSDPDGTLDNSSIVIEEAPSNGSVTVDETTGEITYNHDGSETSTDSFAYSVADDDGARSNLATVNVSITNTNDAPTANDDSALVGEGNSTTIDVLENDSDPDGTLNNSSVVIEEAPSNGTVTVNSDGSISYTHDGSETSSDSFGYSVADDDGARSNVASVNISISNTNDAPSANDDSASVDEGNSTTIEVLANDSDPDGSLNNSSVQIEEAPENGTVTVNEDGTITYSHDGSETSSDSFAYSVADDDGARSNVARVAVSVTSTNDAPTANDDTGSVDEGNSTTIKVLANDSDPDGTLNNSSVVIEDAPSNGTVTVDDDGTITYTHDGSETTSDSFTYSVADDDGARSNVARVAISVTNMNDAPSVDNYSVTEAGSPNPHAEITADWKVGDADGNLDTVLIEVIDADTGSVVRSATHSVNGSDASGTDQFNIKHVDGETYDVTITVTDTAESASSETSTITE